MSNKKYALETPDLRDTLVGMFGTRKHAYDRLRLNEVGMDMPTFYRIWRQARCSLVEFQTLTAMIELWWAGRPDTYHAYARYHAPFSEPQLNGWRRNLTSQEEQR